jgi:hypothetical protein
MNGMDLSDECAGKYQTTSRQAEWCHHCSGEATMRAKA